MAYDNYGFTVEDALARSQDVFEVDVTEWGDTISSSGSVPVSEGRSEPWIRSRKIEGGARSQTTRP